MIFDPSQSFVTFYKIRSKTDRSCFINSVTGRWYSPECANCALNEYDLRRWLNGDVARYDGNYKNNFEILRFVALVGVSQIGTLTEDESKNAGSGGTVNITIDWA